MRARFFDWALRNRFALLFLLFLAVGAPFSPPSIFQIGAGTGISISAPTGPTATVSLVTPVAIGNGGTSISSAASSLPFGGITSPAAQSLALTSGGTTVDIGFTTGSIIGLTVSSSTTSIFPQNSYFFSGDGHGLTTLNPANLSTTVAVNKGGTGAATLTNHGVLLGQATSAVVGAAAGTTGQVFTSGGASADGAYADPVTFTFNSASLSSSPFLLNQTNGTFQDIGLSLTLPAAGTFIVGAEVRTELQMTTGAGIITCKFQNSTDATDIANSERLADNTVNTGQYTITTVPMTEIITVAASKTIKTLCCRNSGTYNTSQIVSATDGRSRIYYVRIK